MGIIVKEFVGIRKAIDEKKKTITSLVSDDSIDHDGEIVALEAWDSRLPEYRKNPLFCWGHPLGKRECRPEDILGKTVLVERTSEGLVATMEYAVDVNPVAKMAWEMALADILKAYSVGGDPFAAVGWWDSPEKIATLNPKYQEAIKQGKASLVMTDIELWEISQVPKGANRNAIFRAVREGIISKSAIAPLLGKEYPVFVPVLADFSQKSATSEAQNESKQEPEAPKPEPAPSAKAEPDSQSTPQLDLDEAELAALLAEDPGLADTLADLLSELI